MQKIADNVYIEEQYLGVTLAAISMPHGLIQIDAPPSVDDSRGWRAALLNLGAGVERLLISLDAHPDRTLGVRAMECIVVAHDKTAQAFRNRPNTFKALGEETGADWEGIAGLGTVRWAVPDITFSQQLQIHWNDNPVLLEHHPGPGNGAIWVTIPHLKIVFVGDAVIKNQPPFLSSANLTAWVESLQTLLSSDHRGYTVISGRGGPVTDTVIRNQLDFILQVKESLDKLDARQAPPEATEDLVEPLLSALKFPAARHKQFAQRLRYGLHHYYTRHYHPTSNKDEE